MDSTTPNIAHAAPTPSTAATVSRSEARPTTAAADVAGSADARAATKHSAEQEAALQRDPRSLQFQVDGHRVITTIVDENDKTVVVQIPDAEMIRIAKSIDRMQGFLVKSKA